MALPVYSTIAPADIADVVADRYGLAEIERCELWHRGCNDLYRLRGADRDLAVRVYDRGWRTEAEIRFELAALAHLERAGAPAHRVVLDVDGNNLTVVRAAEGERQLAVFGFLPGTEAKAEHTAAMGRALALVHAATADLAAPAGGRAIDLDYLLTGPLSLVPRTARGQHDIDFTRAVGDVIVPRIAAIADRLDHGFCHGDVQRKNASVDETGDVTLFDFDCCGVGWRAFDLAAARFELFTGGTGERWDEFADAYTANGPCDDIDVEAVDLFVVALVIWSLGFHARLVDVLGRVSFRTDGYWGWAYACLAREELPWSHLVADLVPDRART